MTRMHITFAALLLGGTSLLANETKIYHESSTPKVLSEWCKSEDAKISVCLTAGRTAVGTNDILKLCCAVRNDTDRSLTIMRPFGDSFYAHSSGINILGPDGLISYHGAWKDYILGTGSFVELQPHNVVEEILEIPNTFFPGLGAPGLYVIGYVFISNGYPKAPAPENFWQGRIKAKSVTILMK